MNVDVDVYIGHPYRHIKSGRLYQVLDCGKMKVNDKWSICIIYRPLYANPITTFVRTLDDFKENFNEADNEIEL